MKKKSPTTPWMEYWVLTLTLITTHAHAMGKAAPIAMGPDWPASSNITTLQVPYTPGTTETVLQMNFSMKCAPQPTDQQEIFRGITGQLNIGSRTTRINLFEGESLVELNIADATASFLNIALDPNPLCTLTNLQAATANQDFSSAADAVTEIALENSPYLGIRDDQYTNRYTDLPMLMSYRVYPDAKHSNNTDIDYIIYYSDEDSGKKASSKSGDDGNYGRSGDIEWVYKIEFDPNWNPVSRVIQTSIHVGPISLGFGHSQETFKGKYIGAHPIIYDATLDNVGADHPKDSKKPLTVYQMVPRMRLGLTEDIDDALLMSPWSYEVTDDEQTAEGKAPAPVADHIFVMVEGELEGVGPFGWATGKFAAEITAIVSGETTSYMSETTGVSRAAISGDRWLRDSITTAVLIPEVQVQRIEDGTASGTLTFKKESFIRPDLNVKAIRFFRVLGDATGVLETRELTQLFTCAYDGVNSKCDFGARHDSLL
jgi:hypothetical protein